MPRERLKYQTKNKLRGGIDAKLKRYPNLDLDRPTSTLAMDSECISPHFHVQSCPSLGKSNRVESVLFFFFRSLISFFPSFIFFLCFFALELSELRRGINCRLEDISPARDVEVGWIRMDFR